MIKNIFDAITHSVEAYGYWGIGVAFLILLLYLAKIYFKINPLPEENNLARNPEVKEVIFENAQMWIQSKKEISTWNKTKIPSWNNSISLVSFGKEKRCLIAFHKDNLSISIFYRISSYAIANKFDFLTTVSNNSSEISKEVKSIYYQEYYKSSIMTSKKRKKLCYIFNSNNYEREVIELFRVDKIKSIIEYEFFDFLKQRQIL